MRKIRKVIALMLLAIICLQTDNLCRADEVIRNEVWSEEYPDAYIITEHVENNNTLFSRSNKQKEDEVEATVFVEENYKYINGERIVTESRLLSKNEVEEIGIDNFDDINNNISSRSSNSRGKLKISFKGIYTKKGKGISATLTGNAKWSGLGSNVTASSSPAAGNDYIGIAWAGGYQASNSACTATWNNGSARTVYLSEATPNAGREYEFGEYGNAAGKYQIYVNNVNIKTTLKKNKLTGNGNTAEAVLKYIHTYQSNTGNISISATPSSVGAGFSLSNTQKQWSLSCVVNGIPY